ncbi:MAG TPA: NifU family protein [Polyangia bacterium]|nr:NifU family protein [Polyangia bacterium]
MSREDPRAHAARIEQLLGDVRASLGPVQWQRVDELVSRLTALYGAAIGRTLYHVEEAGKLDEGLRARLCDDELVGALLALHGMHPDPPLARARAAAARVRVLLGEGAGSIDLALDDEGVLAVTLGGSWRTAMPRAAVDEALRRAIEEAAPELAAIEIGGVEFGGSSAEPAPLVQLDVARSRAGAAGT